ncbi:MAG: ABC transporter substrate-binding protein [Atopobiaceae bacterium]|nr:ABC transporter substrate-binding protein [Atopobiaceae bacterium]
MNKIDALGFTRRSFLKAAGAVGACGAGLMLAACGSNAQSTGSSDSKDSGSSSKYEPVSVNVAFMPNLGSAGTLFAALDQGYFDKFNITVETKQFDAGPAEIAAMQSGDIDFAQIGHGAHALCIEGQAKIFSFEGNSQADCVVANKSHGISTAKDLKGKTIAVASGTSSEVILNYVLADAGLTKDDVTLTEMKVDGMTTAMIAGQIDACATWSPNTITLEEQLGDDYLVLGTNTDYTDKVAFPSSYVCLPDYADSNKEVLERFEAALDMGKVYRAEHIDEVAKLLADKLGLPEETLLQSTGEGDWQGAVDAIGDTDKILGYYKAQQQVFLDNGRITEAVPVENYVLSEVITEGDKLYKENK